MNTIQYVSIILFLFIVSLIGITLHMKIDDMAEEPTIIKLERCQVELNVYKSEMDLTLREPVEIIKIGEN